MSNTKFKEIVHNIIKFIKTKYDIFSHEAYENDYVTGTKSIEVIFDSNFSVEYFTHNNNLIKDYWGDSENLTKEFNKYLLVENRVNVIDSVLN